MSDGKNEKPTGFSVCPHCGAETTEYRSTLNNGAEKIETECRSCTYSKIVYRDPPRRKP